MIGAAALLGRPESASAPSVAAPWITRIACGCFLVACLAVYGIDTIAPARTGTAYIVVHAALTVAMLAAWAAGGAAQARLIAVSGIVARLILIAAPMLSSNDAERYLWDGAVALAGFDPYSVPPADPMVAGLRAIWATPPEHAAYPTLYPPVALAIFAGSALAGPVWGIWVWKLVASIAGIAVVPLAHRLLRRHGLERHLALVALSPLLVLETGVGAHVDSLIALVIVAALLAFDARRPGLVGALLGLGACIKLLPAAALIGLGLAMGWRALLRMGAAATGTVAAIYGAALAIGWRPIGSLPVFFEKWRNGSPLFTLLEAMLPTSGLITTLAILAIVLLGTALLLARARPVLATQVAMATPLLLSPVAFPWYLLALVPLAALTPSVTLLGWLTLSPLVYEVRDRFVSEGIWMPATWPLMVIGAGWMTGLAIDAMRARFRLSAPDREA